MDDEKKLRILMVEDNKDERVIIERTLRKGNLSFVNECVETLEEFKEALFRFNPDIVLSDHGMPAFNSYQALEICLRERSDIPFILVTGTVSDDYAISCLKNGMDDYILKANLSRLPTAIRTAVTKRSLEKLRKEAEIVLRKQNEELLKVNKELDNFVYSVSHNLRGPLVSVVGLLNVADNVNHDPETEGLHAMMRSSISRLDETLKDILEYSRNSRNEIASDVPNWAKIIEEAFAKVAYLHPAENITSSITLNTTTPFRSDNKRLSVVFNNLLDNCISYRNKSIALNIIINIATSDENVHITMQDNGIGIKKDVLPRVYDMFYRGTEESHGSGLGLYIVKEIIEKLKGKIVITSVVTSGTTVTLTIPNRLITENLHLATPLEAQYQEV